MCEFKSSEVPELITLQKSPTRIKEEEEEEVSTFAINLTTP